MKQQNSSQRRSIIAALFLGVTAVLTLLFLMMGWGGQEAAVSAAPASPTAPVIYVDIDAKGAADGTSWADAYPNLNDAIEDQLHNYTAEIWIAEGVYYPDVGGGQSNDDRSASFTMQSIGAIFGGFDGTETSRDQRDWETHLTVLSGDIDHETSPDITDGNGVTVDAGDIRGNNAYHVVIYTFSTAGVGDPTLDGLTISGGLANGSLPGDDVGGGFYNLGSGIDLFNLSILGNKADTSGGGIFNSNHATEGVIYPLVYMVDLIISGNAAGNGGGVYNATLISPALERIHFSGNAASASGGGMYSDTLTRTLKLNDVLFSGNSAGDFGGGMFTRNSSPTLVNATSPTLVNVTFAANQANQGGGMANEGSSPAVTNAIFWDNQASVPAEAAISNAGASRPVLSYSLVQGSNGSGSSWDNQLGSDAGHNIDIDPQFITPIPANSAPTTAGNLRLKTTSPAIDVGNNVSVTKGTDLDGYPRIAGGVVDLGPYEYQGLFQDKVICVNAAAAGPGSGSCWDDPFKSLQDALTAAGSNSEIWIAAGVYYPDEGAFQTNDARESTFKLSSGVPVYGGFAGTETSRDQRNWTSSITVLSGDIDHETKPDITDANGIITGTVTISLTESIKGDNAYHVVSIRSDNTLLDGVTISAGLANSEDLASAEALGGGVLQISGATTKLTNVSLTGNLARLGGGMSSTIGKIFLTDVSFTGNRAKIGGGLHSRDYSVSLVNTLFEGNHGFGLIRREDYPGLWFYRGTGGGMWTESTGISMLNVSFKGNEALNQGGGIFISLTSMELTNVDFLQNKGRVGGGIYSEGGKTHLTQVVFSQNIGRTGGGLYLGKAFQSVPSDPNPPESTLVNVIFSGNGSTQTNTIGGGIYHDFSKLTLTNVTISGNLSEAAPHQYGSGLFNRSGNVDINNSIIWGNTPVWKSIAIENGTIRINHSLIQTSGGSGSGWNSAVGIDEGDNIDTDPLFGTPPLNFSTPGDYHLRPGSPAANAGDNSHLPAGLTTDLDGSPRIINGIVDMGVYESAMACPPQGTNTLHVRQGATGSSGATWADALGSLLDALGLAKNCGGIHDIWVAAGVYYPDVGTAQSNNDRTQSFQLLNGVGVYGGFSGHETIRTQRNWRSNLTVLSGDIDGNDGVDANGIITSTANINGANSYHVVSGSGTDSSAALDGFTITAGQAVGPAASSQHAGGGLLNNGGSPTVAHLAFTGNMAQDGGGMANLKESHPTLTNIAFSANMATLFGGGLYNNDSHPTLTNVALSGNAALSGGGIFNQHSDPDLINLTVTGNQAVSGLTVDGLNLPSAMATVPTGGGMFNNDSSPSIRNSIFWNNKDSSGTGTVSATIHNEDFGSLPGYAYSLIQSSGGSGAWISDFGFNSGHNIDVDPLFRTAVDPAGAPSGGGDLELTHSSPAIDTAFNSTNSTAADLAGDPRIADGTGDGKSVIDMGAYEFRYLDVVKTADKASAQVGETITYNYVITNKSAVTIDNLKAIDNKLGEVTLGTTTLAAGAGTSGSLTYIIKETDPNPLINIVAVTGATPTEIKVGDSASASVALPGPPPIPGNPAISAKVTADKTSAAVGETITYTYLVTNTGDELLDHIVANDSFWHINLDKTSLAPAESTSVEVKHTVTADDLPSPLINTLTVKGSPPVGDDVTAQDQVPVVIFVRKIIYMPVILKQAGQ